MKTSKIFELVLKHYTGGFICWRISEMQQEGVLAMDDATHAKNIIEKRLGEFDTYKEWLRNNHPDFYYDHCDVSPGREQWLAALVKEFKARGD